MAAQQVRTMGLLLFAAVSPTCTQGAQAAEGGGPIVDADFPGGNIVVDRVEGDEVFVHQDLRDTAGDWFYWYFRVRGAAGRTLTVRFTQGDVIGVRGPAASTDGGATWSWLGREGAEGASFQYAVPEAAEEVRFCLAVPYLEADLRRFVERRAGSPHLRAEALCQTTKGRSVERLRLGRLDGQCDYRVLITCRHHACEMMASYALEGVMESVLAADDDGRWLREHVEMLVIPFVDKDGVEDGDQGKNRRPHDPNRDYAGESLYPSVRALREFVPEWSQGRLRVALDLHCPYVQGQHNEDIYFVGTPDQANWRRVQRLGAVLESVRTGPLPYRREHNLPFGEAWNTYVGPLKSLARWATELPGMRAASTIEIPYANASGQVVTADSARAFGRDLARALRSYLEEEAAGQPASGREAN